MDLAVLGLIPVWARALAVIFIIVCLVLIVLVLLQKGKGSGLAAAFGGAGGQSAFGSKTGDVFTWATIVVVAVFLLMAMFLTMKFKPELPDEHLPGAELLERGEGAGVPPTGQPAEGLGGTAAQPLSEPTGTAGEGSGASEP